MTENELKTITLTRAIDLIRDVDISPTELTEAVLRRIEALNGRMNVFITVTAESALQQAARPAAGELHGIPIALKDLFDTKGVRTTAGSRVYSERIPTEDATVVTKLKQAGAVIVGKTNMHEFAFGVTNVNPFYGTVRNPWDPERIAGGSSGGSAAAVALSMALGAAGSDTGGSIRIPAALCGVVGLKPTYGMVSVKGTIPLAESLDHCGPLTRTVEDAARMLGVIAEPGASSGDAPRDIRKLRIGMPRSYFFDRVDPEVLSAFRAAIQTLQDLGAQIVDVDFSTASMQEDVFKRIAGSEAYAYHRPLLERFSDLYGKDVRARIEAGRDITVSVDYLEAQEMRTTMKEDFARVLAMADVVATPTTPITAPLIDQTEVQWPGASEAVPSALTRLTRPFNLVGVPAVSVPCGFSSNGLPIGLQLAGREFDERTVLLVAGAYERATEWSRRQTTL